MDGKKYLKEYLEKLEHKIQNVNRNVFNHRKLISSIAAQTVTGMGKGVAFGGIATGIVLHGVIFRAGAAFVASNYFLQVKDVNVKPKTA